MKKIFKAVSFILALTLLAPMAMIQADAGMSGTQIEDGGVYSLVYTRG